LTLPITRWFRSEFIHPQEFAPVGFSTCVLAEREDESLAPALDKTGAREAG